MILRRLVPHPLELDLATDAGRDALRAEYRHPDSPWLRLNLITSVGGDAAGPDGTSESLSNPVDRRILGAIRAACDVVLVGAESVRQEGYRLPKTARLAVLTATGDLDGHRISGDTARLLVVAPESARDRIRAALGEAPELVLLPGAERPGIHSVVSALRDRGLDRIVCEGGPGVARQLLDADLVDEVCVSTAPVVTGATLPPFGRAPGLSRPVRLAALWRDERDALYAVWRRDRRATSG